MEKVEVPMWVMELVEDTLRIQYNIRVAENNPETCQDRNIRESLNCVRKIINGIEPNGNERFEKLVER